MGCYCLALQVSLDPRLLFCIQRVLGLLEELRLQLQAFVVGLDGLEGFGDLAGPCLLVELAQLLCRRGTVAGVVVREARVPPDSGVDVVGKVEAVLVGAGLLMRAVLVYEVGPGDHHVGRLGFAGVHVVLRVRLHAGPAGQVCVRQAEDVDHVVARRGQLRLSEERQQRLIAAVTVHDNDFLAAVARHLLHRLLQQGELRREAVRDGAGLLLRFEYLAEIVLGKDDGVLLLDGVHHGEPHVEQVGAEGQMRAVLFDDAEGQHAHALRLVDGADKVGGGEFFPFRRKLLRLRGAGSRDGNECGNSEPSQHKDLFNELRYSDGSCAVNGEQQGFSVAWKFISSARMPSGSYMLNWPLPSLPILVPLSARTPSSRPPSLRVLKASSTDFCPSEKWSSTPSVLCVMFAGIPVPEGPLVSMYSSQS